MCKRKVDYITLFLSGCGGPARAETTSGSGKTNLKLRGEPGKKEVGKRT